MARVFFRTEEVCFFTAHPVFSKAKVLISSYGSGMFLHDASVFFHGQGVFFPTADVHMGVFFYGAHTHMRYLIPTYICAAIESVHFLGRSFCLHGPSVILTAGALFLWWKCFLN